MKDVNNKQKERAKKKKHAASRGGKRWALVPHWFGVCSLAWRRPDGLMEFRQGIFKGRVTLREPEPDWEWFDDGEIVVREEDGAMFFLGADGTVIQPGQG